MICLKVPWAAGLGLSTFAEEVRWREADKLIWLSLHVSPLVTAAEAAVELPAEIFPQLINITKYGRMSLISANFVLSTAPTPSSQIYILMEQDNPKIAQKDNFNNT